MTGDCARRNIAIVLHRPRVPENIGAAARAARNMGIGRLVVAAPRDLDRERVAKMATHAAMDMVEAMTVTDTLKEALADFSWVVGTTARTGGERRVISSPALLAPKIRSLAVKNKVALVFGPEDRGLTNEDLRLCHEVVTIPTADFSSLNLAQAVMVFCYELSRSSHAADGRPRLATRYELDGMYDQVRDMLVKINYINQENPDYWLGKVRQFFTRLELRAREVSIVRGICRQMNWYGEKRYQDGRAAAAGAALPLSAPREAD